MLRKLSIRLGKNWPTESSFDWKLVLDIPVIVAGATVDVVCGGLAMPMVPASALNLGLEVMQEVVPKNRTANVEANFDSALTRFKDDLEAIDHHMLENR